MALERRFQTGFRTVDKDTPGLVEEDDGTVWLVDPDGTRHQLPGGGGDGCEYLTCADDLATLQTVQTFVIAQAEGAESEAYVAAQDDAFSTRAGIDAQLDGTQEVSSITVLAQSTDGNPGATVVVRSSDVDGFSSVVVTADRKHFDGGTPIVNPTFDLSSGTAAQLAQMLADLGLIDVVA